MKSSSTEYRDIAFKTIDSSCIPYYYVTIERNIAKYDLNRVPFGLRVTCYKHDIR